MVSAQRHNLVWGVLILPGVRMLVLAAPDEATAVLLEALILLLFATAEMRAKNQEVQFVDA